MLKQCSKEEGGMRKTFVEAKNDHISVTEMPQEYLTEEKTETINTISQHVQKGKERLEQNLLLNFITRLILKDLFNNLRAKASKSSRG